MNLSWIENELKVKYKDGILQRFQRLSWNNKSVQISAELNSRSEIMEVIREIEPIDMACIYFRTILQSPWRRDYLEWEVLDCDNLIILIAVRGELLS